MEGILRGTNSKQKLNLRFSPRINGLFVQLCLKYALAAEVIGLDYNQIFNLFFSVRTSFPLYLSPLSRLPYTFTLSSSSLPLFFSLFSLSLPVSGSLSLFLCLPRLPDSLFLPLFLPLPLSLFFSLSPHSFFFSSVEVVYTY